MNYYERYCGDYARDTGHLSLMDHGVYTLLLDAYYSTAKPLPPDPESLNRICRAMNPTERNAVRKVADEFFPIAEDGLRHNARADREVSKAMKRIGASKVNGKHGGRPPKNPTGSDIETQQEPGGLLNDNPAGNPVETQPGEALPDPMHHNPHPEKQNPGVRVPRKTPLPPGFAISDRVRQWAADKGHDRLDERLEHFVGYAKRSGKTYVDWDEAFMGAIRENWAKLEPKQPAKSASFRPSL